MSAEVTADDWERLRSEAVAAARKAYAPYSGLQVGSAALTDDGRIVTGCNVEHASYPVGLCAEATMSGQLRLSGGGRFVAGTCRPGEGEPLLPCGRCRQLWSELGGPGCPVDTPRGVQPLSEVRPQAFGPEDLPS